MADSQSLFDVLAGAVSPGGNGINRPALNSAVASSQALNGLRAAQTDDAWETAQKARIQQMAASGIKDKLTALGYSGAEGDLAQAQLQAGGSPNDLFSSLTKGVEYAGHRDLANPALLNTPTQTAAQQGIQGKVALEAAPNQIARLPGQTPISVEATPEGTADVAMKTAMGNLHQAQADVGGFNPHTAGVSSLPQEQQDAITKAIVEHRLDPAKVNSRNAGILAQAAVSNPTLDFNQEMTNGAMQRNAGMQNKFMVMDSLPGVLSHMTSLGKQVGYSDNATIGKMQQWFKGEFNDPALTEYMTVRNDALMKLAGVMRGVGMSDQAHSAEIEAANPTLAPYALDAWLKGQMSVVTPQLEKFRKIMKPNSPGAEPAPPGAGPSSYASEAEALAAGHKVGDKVTIGGVSGTLQ